MLDLGSILVFYTHYALVYPIMLGFFIFTKTDLLGQISIDDPLVQDVEKDKEEFKEILKTMKCCGRVYIVFHTQVSMVRVLRERRGLRKQILLPTLKLVMWSMVIFGYIILDE